MEYAQGKARFSQAAGFALLHVPLWAALSLQYYRVENQPVNFIGAVFGLLFSVGHFFAFSLLLMAGAALAVAVLGRSRAAKWATLALGTAATFLLAGDLIVYTLFRLHLSPSLVNIFFDASPFEIYDPPSSFYVMLLAGAAAVCATEAFLWRLAAGALMGGRKLKLALVFFLALAASNVIHAVAVVKAYPPVLARAGALPYAFPLSAQKELMALGLTPVDSPHEWGEELLGAGLNYPKAEVTVNPGPSPLNVIVILIDAWRIDSFTPQIMPRLYQRAEKSIFFNNHFSGGNATRCGVFSLFYGIPASYFHPVLAKKTEPILMTKLRESGYDFGIFSSAGFTSVDIAQTTFVRLNDKLVRAYGPSTPDKDAAMERNFLNYLRQRNVERPFFGFAFYDLLHGKKPFPDLPQPFQPAKPWNYLELRNDIDLTPYLNTYNNAAHTLDIHLDNLLNEMEDLGLFENSLIVITGDHGEEVNDSRTNSWGHNSNFSRHQLQVPFLMFRPGAEGQTRSYLTRHYDFPVTIMEQVLGADPASAPDYTLGVNLFEDRGREVTIAASYSDKAVLYDGNVFVLKKYGLLKTYDYDGRPNEVQIPPAALKRALNEMRYFQE